MDSFLRYDGYMINVSCIVPSFKRIDQTLKTLDLLLASDGVGASFALEVIVSDSTPDNSLKDAVEQKFGDRIRYIKPEKPGIATNKNAGAKIAQYPILIFCDSDIEVEKNTLIHAVVSIKKHEKAGAIGGNVFWKGGPHNGQKDRPRMEDRMYMREDATYIEALYSRFLVTYRDVFAAVGGYDEAVFNMRGEGSDLSVRYWRAGYPLVYDGSIAVHHVHDVPDAAAVRVNHPEWGIAKDLLLLSYKYSEIEEDYHGLAASIAATFAPLGIEGYYRMLQGIGKHLDDITASKPILDEFRQKDKPVYDFKFLEIFSERTLLDRCLREAAKRLASVRQKAFGA